MTDSHRHSWKVVACRYKQQHPAFDDPEFDWVIAECNCGEQMHGDIIEEKLNAVEWWSSDDARHASNTTLGMQREVWNSGGDEIDMKYWHGQTKKLLAYAKALEGDDA